ARALPTLAAGRKYPDYLEAWSEDGGPSISSDSLDEQGKHLELLSPIDTHFRILNMKMPDGRLGRGLSSPVNKGESTGSSRAPYSRRYGFVLIGSCEELHETIQNTGLSLLMVGGSLTAVIVLVVLSSVRKELRPLRDFSDEVGKLNETTLSKRFEADPLVAELQPIALRMNDLLERLEQAFARERRFTGNVAHELRTPLAELRCMIEVARKWPLEGNELDRHNESALNIVRRMSAVVETLIRLVRTDGLRSSLKMEAVNLPACLRAAWSSHEPRAHQRGVRASFQMPDHLEVQTEPVILISLLDNLFCNAATYARANSQIECIVDSIASSGAIRIQITNEAPDISEADLQHLEEPFWRKDASRTATDHAGLGLALVREYAKLLDVSCQYRLIAPNRFSVEIVWNNASV
ncbi:MAG TPA: histidine kinase dimerization/phospho-acceptor domain-containing protein, partial [Tepidisphaeraceae bacterium]|nr:histidine kinase dimerization/phospho-acceptor domain-containing protein [Tepidisphaeraceae bacterium]